MNIRKIQKKYSSLTRDDMIHHGPNYNLENTHCTNALIVTCPWDLPMFSEMGSYSNQTKMHFRPEVLIDGS